MQVTVRMRSACTDVQRDAFVALAAEGGEVPIGFIESGIDRARALLWMVSDGKFNGATWIIYSSALDALGRS